MPIPVISVGQMREWEKATWATGQTEAAVIARVGQALAVQALRLTKPQDGILILAGNGHNGDDARAAAKWLPERRVTVLDIIEPGRQTPDILVAAMRRTRLVIDGLFGIGLNRPLNAEWCALVQQVNDLQIPILAMDVPSGLNAETGQPEGAAIEASVTLTVGAPKAGMLLPSAWRYVGKLVVTPDVGLVPCPFESEMQWTLPEDFMSFPPRRPVDGHKGDFGRLTIIAGSPGFHGAGVLAAHGAQRARPGLITLHTPEPSYLPIASQLQAVMVSPWRRELELPGESNAILIGPGLAWPELPEEFAASTRRLWQTAPVPLVVDASALAWLPPGPLPPEAIRVITPHPGEAARLLGTSAKAVQADRPKALREISRRFGNCWVVLKGHETLVGRAVGHIRVNSSGDAYLAQGGSGDLLSGYLAGLLAQRELQKDPLAAICYGVWQHGATADYLTAHQRNWVIEDLASSLGKIASFD